MRAEKSAEIPAAVGKDRKQMEKQGVLDRKKINITMRQK